jgi:hypothetical protein
MELNATSTSNCNLLCISTSTYDLIRSGLQSNYKTFNHVNVYLFSLAEDVTLVDGTGLPSILIFDLIFNRLGDKKTNSNVLTSQRGSSSLACTLRPVRFPGSVMHSLTVPTLSEVFESGPIDQITIY